MQDKLHVIIPFFNITNSLIRIQNLEKCIKHLQFCENVILYIAEGYIDNPNFENHNLLKNENINYIKYKMTSPLWIKENLINLTISKFPSDWEYVAWIDSDIIFLNFNFANHAIQKLQNNDIIQLFRSVSFVDKNGDIYTETDGKNKHIILLGFILSYKKYQKYGHPGFAWAMKKSFYEKIEGLFEYNIIGAADLLMAQACINQKFNYSNPSEEFKNLINDYYHKFINVKFDYIQGHIFHLYHGLLNSREYDDRWKILINHKFAPSKDLIKNNNIIQIINKNLEKDIFDYFKRREIQ